MCQLDQNFEKSNFTQCVCTGYIGSLTLFLNIVYYKLLLLLILFLKKLSLVYIHTYINLMYHHNNSIKLMAETYFVALILCSL